MHLCDLWAGALAFRFSFCLTKSVDSNIVFVKHKVNRKKFMANQLPTEKKTTAITMPCEGASIRAVERMTGIHRDTVMRLGVRVSEGCKAMMDEKLRGLPCKNVQVDEVWGFIGMKKKTAKLTHAAPQFGDVWTWIAIDADTKLVPTFAIGDRSQYMANTFMDDLASRLSNRVQLSSDALRAY